MLRSTLVMAMLLGLSFAATLNKKEGYGGSSATYSSPSYGTSGSSYDAGSAPASYSSGSEISYGSSPSASYNSGSSSYGSGTSYNSADSHSSTGDSGNLYYYYYPVTNHSSPSYGGADSYSSGGGGGGGGGGANYGGGNNYYPPAPVPSHFSDPLGGLLSLAGAIDVNSLILPALLIGGVALLLPAILNCDLELGTCVIPLPFSNTGRNGRQMDDWNLQQATIPQMIDHAYKIYDAVSSDDQCMQRVVCELGGMMRNVRGKEFFFSVLEQFSSPSTKKQLYIFREGALTSSTSNPACHKFLCRKLDKVD
ncbi:hypothetical protein CHUAL_012504 [Chamberlinius hualienensis]